MQTLLSLAAPEVVVMTTSGATSDNKVGIYTTFGFQYNDTTDNVEYTPWNMHMVLL